MARVLKARQKDAIKFGITKMDKPMSPNSGISQIYLFKVVFVGLPLSFSFSPKKITHNSQGGEWAVCMPPHSLLSSVIKGGMKGGKRQNSMQKLSLDFRATATRLNTFYFNCFFFFFLSSFLTFSLSVYIFFF